MKVQLNSLLLVVDSVNYLVVQQKFNTLFLQNVLETNADFLIEERTDTIGVLDNCYIRAKARINGAHFETDNSTADNNHLLWNCL